MTVLCGYWIALFVLDYLFGLLDLLVRYCLLVLEYSVVDWLFEYCWCFIVWLRCCIWLLVGFVCLFVFDLSLIDYFAWIALWFDVLVGYLVVFDFDAVG